MRGNEKDCICHKPKGKHTKRCDAYRLSEYLKRVANNTVEVGIYDVLGSIKKQEPKFVTIKKKDIRGNYKLTVKKGSLPLNES